MWHILNQHTGIFGRVHTCQYHRVSTPAGTTSASIERLDASYDWLPAPPEQSAPLEFFGNGCTDVQPYDLHGKVRAAGSSSCHGMHQIRLAETQQRPFSVILFKVKAQSGAAHKALNCCQAPSCLQSYQRPEKLCRSRLWFKTRGERKGTMNAHMHT